MSQFHRGQTVREKRSGKQWHVTHVYHPERGASILAYHPSWAGGAENEQIFKEHEIEPIHERKGSPCFS